MEKTRRNRRGRGIEEGKENKNRMKTKGKRKKTKRRNKIKGTWRKWVIEEEK